MRCNEVLCVLFLQHIYTVFTFFWTTPYTSFHFLLSPPSPASLLVRSKVVARKPEQDNKTEKDGDKTQKDGAQAWWLNVNLFATKCHKRDYKNTYI